MTNELAREPSEVTQDQMYTAVFHLHSALREAYWSTPDEATGNLVTALADSCYHILTELNRADIRSRTEEFQQLTQIVNATNARLKEVQEDINHIVQAVTVATKVVNATDQVVKLAGKFFV